MPAALAAVFIQGHDDNLHSGSIYLPHIILYMIHDFEATPFFEVSFAFFATFCIKLPNMSTNPSPCDCQSEFVMLEYIVEFLLEYGGGCI